MFFKFETITGTIFLVYNLVNKRSNIVAIPNAKANPLIGPTAKTYSKNAADNDTKSAVNIVFHDSSTALFAANSNDLPTLISSLSFSNVTI